MPSLKAELVKTVAQHFSRVKHTAQNNWQQGHEDGQQNDWEVRGDETKNDRWAVVDERKPGELFDQVIHVGNSTDERDRDGPEYDKNDDKGDRCSVSDDELPPLDPQIGPNDALWSHTDITGGHMQGLVVRNCKLY